MISLNKYGRLLYELQNRLIIVLLIIVFQQRYNKDRIFLIDYHLNNVLLTKFNANFIINKQQSCSAGNGDEI